MKNEDKIVELLTESLKRLDRQELVQNKMLEALVGMKSEIQALRVEVQELNSSFRSEVLGRIERLEEAVFRKGA